MMRALSTTTALFGCMAASAAYAQSTMGPAIELDPLFQSARPMAERILLGRRAAGVGAAYPFSSSRDKSFFGYVGGAGEAALGPPLSLARRYVGVDDPLAVSQNHWLYPANTGADAFTVGYKWRDLKIERSAFSSDVQDVPASRNSLKLDSRSVRLSFNPAPNWTVQVSRGSLSGLDQLVPSGDVRRTTISATYHRSIVEGDWQTTIAWGRNARKFRDTTMGYLLESTLRFSGPHVVFGRLEQVGSDDLVRRNDSVQAEEFKMNKLTVGYFQDINAHGRIRFDVGALVSRHLVPSSMTIPYGTDPTAFMVFIRLKPQ